MSQEKVEKYKQDKANRQKIMRREKLIRRIEYGGSAIVLLALIVWFSFAVYKNVEAGNASRATTTEMDATAVQEYINNLNSSSEAAE
ncbi:MAG TPA: hypothetical protein IAC62_00220 [Candidatus Pelethocola excrementipullorum]|nr:hypothetical protein [Candidatus Pelethocola excrementipullorum]